MLPDTGEMDYIEIDYAILNNPFILKIQYIGFLSMGCPHLEIKKSKCRFSIKLRLDRVYRNRYGDRYLRKPAQGTDVTSNGLSLTGRFDFDFDPDFDFDFDLELKPSFCFS